MTLSDQILGFLRRRLGFRPGRSALVRIGAVALITMYVVSAIVPSRSLDPADDKFNVAAPSPFSRNISAARGDQRGFYPTSGDDVFRVAWVAGSSIQGVTPGDEQFLPAELFAGIPSVDGRPVSVDMYFLTAMRTEDNYIATREAIESDPDLLVVTLNPLWVLNDSAVQSWVNLDGQLVDHALLDPSSWSIAASFASPSDAVWGLLGRHFGAIRDRYHWGVDINNEVSSWTLLDDVTPVSSGEPSELERIARLQAPVFFWGEQEAKTAGPLTVEQRQAAAFERSLESSSINRALIEDQARIIERASIPTVVYLAPVNDETLANPAVDAALDGIERILAEAGAGLADADHVRFGPTSLSRRLGDLDFRDIIHLFDVTPVADLLRTEVCELLVEQGHEPTCIDEP